MRFWGQLGLGTIEKRVGLKWRLMQSLGFLCFVNVRERKMGPQTRKTRIELILPGKTSLFHNKETHTAAVLCSGNSKIADIVGFLNYYLAQVINVQ